MQLSPWSFQPVVGGALSQIDNKQRVLDACDIVDVVGEHVALRSKGREFVGLCPFHDDHNPSMYVVPHKQIFHCFVCGAGGNTIDFVMRLHGMGFREALVSLAGRAGITLETTRGASGTGSSPSDGSSKDALARANGLALSFFRAILEHPDHGRPARKAIESRGISPEMLQRFELGAAPDRWDGLLSFIESKGVTLQPFIDAGLLKQRAGGDGHYDVLRNRLIFPIHDQSGRAIAFGGRRLSEEDERKYLNSPETPLFDKSATLFGIHQAARAIRSTRCALVCEGYTDVLACHQAGFEHAVATLGTALTPRHAAILRRMCERVILLFDGDDAGQRAADRALEVFFTEPLDVGIVVLPGGRDPDDLLSQSDGAAEFARALETAVDYLEFRFARLRQDLDSRGLSVGSTARARVLEEEVERLIRLGLNELPPIRRSTVVNRLTTLAGVDGEAVSAALGSAMRRGRGGAGTTAETGPQLQRRGALESGLGCLLVDPKLLETDPEGSADILRRAAYASGPLGEIAGAIEDASKSNVVPELGQLLRGLESTEARQTATSLFARLSRETDDDPGRVGQYFRDCLRGMEIERFRAGQGHEAPTTESADFGDRPEEAAADEQHPLTGSRLDGQLADIRQRHARLGGNPLALPRPRAGPT